MKSAIPPTDATLAIDIGNTRTNLGIITTADHTCHATTAFPTGDVNGHLIAACDQLALKCRKPLPKTAVIASVVEAATHKTAALLTSKTITPLTLRDRGALPITLDYQPVDSIGTDRIANALFAHTLYPESAIVVCIGTAITIDFIEAATYRGGAILPGFRLQLEVLSGQTDALPEVVLKEQKSVPDIPARNTADAMLAGVIEGTAGAINHIVASYKKSPGIKDTPVIGTGGDWDLFSPYTQFTAASHPDATLIGTGLLLPYCKPFSV